MAPLPNRELSPLHTKNNNNVGGGGGGDLTHSPDKQLANAAMHGAISSNTGLGGGSQMKRRSVSMLEMADLEDLKEFGDAMDQLEREANQGGEKDAGGGREKGGFLDGANNNDRGGDDGFLFFDAHDEDNDGDNGDNLVTLVAKAAFKEHDNHNPHALLNSGGGGGDSNSGGTSIHETDPIHGCHGHSRRRHSHSSIKPLGYGTRSYDRESYQN